MEKKEPNILEKKQHEVAQKAVDYMQKPIDRSQEAKELLEKRNLDLEKQIENH